MVMKAAAFVFFAAGVPTNADAVRKRLLAKNGRSRNAHRHHHDVMTEVAAAPKDGSDVVVDMGKSGKSRKRDEKIHIVVETSDTHSRGNDCTRGAGNWLCNDYVTAGQGNYDFGVNGLPVGSEVFSVIPELPDEIGKHLTKKEHSVDDEDFVYALKAIQGAEGDGLFGDLGPFNPGWGGIGNYDIYYVKEGESIDFTSFGRFYMKKGKDGKPMHNELVDGEVKSGACSVMDASMTGKCLLDHSAVDGHPWWSWGPDSDNMSVKESKDKVSQVCQDNGEGLTDTSLDYGFDQGIKCTFKEGTPMLVGIGLWRATTGPLQEITYKGQPIGGGPGMVCDKGEEWADPQKVVSQDLYQYVIPVSDSKVKYDFMDCYVCDYKDSEGNNIKGMDGKDLTVDKMYEEHCKQIQELDVYEE